MKEQANGDVLRQISLGDQPLTIEELVHVARGEAALELSADVDSVARLTASVDALRVNLQNGARVYGVTTGFGDSCEIDVAGAAVAQLPLNLVRFHGCGTGELFDDTTSRAVITARLASLVCGYSAVRPQVLENLCALLRAGICPCIPQEGSVGASGDLTPLSYVAAALQGERMVRVDGQAVNARLALEHAGLAPLELGPKESLALMNGTSVMTAVACLAFTRARRLLRLGAALTAMTVDALGADPRQFDARIFQAKPHPGQAAVAAWIREDLEFDTRGDMDGTRLQDRYSIRCAPHILGVLADCLPSWRAVIETELNSANDNPLLDPESGELLHGGNFYGGHIAQVADGLKTCVANLADLFDRQLALLCNPATNHGLPANLVLPQAGAAHHGFKAVQIGTSALAAEAAKLCMPASVFSRSTENHNQDKVSMGTIAVRDATRVLELAETAACMQLLALCQAVDLRKAKGCHRRSHILHQQVRTHVSMNSADRAMDVDIGQVLKAYRANELDIGPVDFG